MNHARKQKNVITVRLGNMVNNSEKTEQHFSILHGPSMELPEPSIIHKYFCLQLSKNPEMASRNWVRYKEEIITYEDLERRATLLAGKLSYLLNKKGLLRKDTRESFVIAVDIAPSHEQVIALLAVIKIGAAYVPIDSGSAINRVRYILNECAPCCILADEHSLFLKDPGTVWSRFYVVPVSDLLKAVSEELSNGNTEDVPWMPVANGISDQTPIAILYTSGSTGSPKGVILTHKTLMNRLTWNWSQFPFKDGEICCYKTSLLFVDSLVEIFSCLLKLMPLVISPEGLQGRTDRFVEFLQENHISRLTLVPSLLRNILSLLKISNDKLPDLKLWMSNSEIISPKLLEEFINVFPSGRTLVNMYGSTETMADVTFQIFEGETITDENVYCGNVSIGCPMINSSVYIVDYNSEILPLGEVGEICVSGLNVASGYVDNEYPNAFTENPFQMTDGCPTWFRTGDFGRIRNQRIIYEGRRDMQVKIRGKRVNTSEIERVVQEFSGVEKVVVLCHQFSENTAVIVAYYTESLKINKVLLKEWCKRYLPDYMIPKLLPILEIPLQFHTRKIDRVALRKMYEKSLFRQNSKELAMLDEKGKKALNILAINLNIPTNAVARHLSFFELGGNSVNMISTIVQLRDHGLHIPIEVFSQAKTVQQIIDNVSVSFCPLHQRMRTDKYMVKRLLEVPERSKIVEILAESFIVKEPLDVLLGVTKDEIMPFAESLYNEALKNDYSLLVVDSNNKIVGGDFLFDYFDGVQVKHHESMTPILSLLSEFEDEVKVDIRSQDSLDLLFNYCLCVHKDLPHADQVQICYLIEGAVLEIARKFGFGGVITNNTNPATQVRPYQKGKMALSFLFINYKNES